MSTPDSLPPQSAPPTDGHLANRLAELERSVDKLRSLLQSSLAVLVFLVAVLNLYLLQQNRLLSYEQTNARESVRQVSTALADHRTNVQPLIERFLNDMQRFSDQNPDFAKQVMTKYVTVRNTNAPARPASPPPATAPAPRR